MYKIEQLSSENRYILCEDGAIICFLIPVDGPKTLALDKVLNREDIDKRFYLEEYSYTIVEGQTYHRKARIYNGDKLFSQTIFDYDDAELICEHLNKKES